VILLTFIVILLTLFLYVTLASVKTHGKSQAVFFSAHSDMVSTRRSARSRNLTNGAFISAHASTQAIRKGLGLGPARPMYRRRAPAANGGNHVRLSLENDMLRTQLKQLRTENARLQRIIAQLKAGRETTIRRAQIARPQFRAVNMFQKSHMSHADPVIMWGSMQKTENQNRRLSQFHRRQPAGNGTIDGWRKVNTMRWVKER
jgi:hypothetical protein